MTHAMHAVARQSPSCYSSGTCRHFWWPKKLERCLIQRTRLCRSCLGVTFGEAGGGSTTMIFFYPTPFFSLMGLDIRVMPSNI